MWSYLLIYISERLNQPAADVAWLMTLNASVGIVTTFLGGAIADRFGRKGVMVFSLLFSGVGWFFFRLADTAPVLALLMIITGATTPLYRLATDAMVADLVPGEQRLEAYSFMRMATNLGVALGPALGGYLASVSYQIAFSVMGIGFLVIGILSAIFIGETRPQLQEKLIPHNDEDGGYAKLFKDKVFIRVLTALTFNRICTSILWLMLAAYTKENYGISERIYGFIPATNAVMVILFQLWVTRRVNRYKSVTAMIGGTLIYAISIFSVAFGTGFWWFWGCMVLATLGEMILVPTATTFIANLAPHDMRARYMSMYSLTWGIGSAIGPLLAAAAVNLFFPRAMWYIAGLAGAISFLIFVRISRSLSRKTAGSLDQVYVKET